MSPSLSLFLFMLNFALDESEQHKMLSLFNRQFSTMHTFPKRENKTEFEYISVGAASLNAVCTLFAFD